MKRVFFCVHYCTPVAETLAWTIMNPKAPFLYNKHHFVHTARRVADRSSIKKQQLHQTRFIPQLTNFWLFGLPRLATVLCKQCPALT